MSSAEAYGLAAPVMYSLGLLLMADYAPMAAVMGILGIFCTIASVVNFIMELKA